MDLRIDVYQYRFLFLLIWHTEPHETRSRNSVTASSTSTNQLTATGAVRISEGSASANVLTSLLASVNGTTACLADSCIRRTFYIYQSCEHVRIWII
jgi:hypothetical protein